MLRTTSFSALLIGLFACSSTTGSTPAPSPPSPSDAESPPPSTCAGTAKLDTAFDVDSSGPDGQIHAYAAPAGDGFFVVYNRPLEGSSSQAFSVYATKLGCDGRVVVPPVRVSDSSDNEIDPAAVWDGTKLLVVWSADTGKAPTNLELRARTLSADGKPTGPVRTLALQRKGKPNVGNAWMPALASVPKGAGSFLAGAWGNDDAPAFQAFVQKLDPNGVLIGDAEDVALAPKSTQGAPSVVVDESGKRFVAWSEEANVGDTPASAWAGEGAPEEVIPGGGAPSLASDVSGTWLTARGAVVELGTKARGKLPATFSQPAIAADANGAAVLAYVGTSGRAPLHAVRVSKGGEVGPEIDLGVPGAAAYPLHVAKVSTGTFLVAYQEGAGTKLRAKARYFEAK